MPTSTSSFMDREDEVPKNLLYCSRIVQDTFPQPPLGEVNCGSAELV